MTDGDRDMDPDSGKVSQLMAEEEFRASCAKEIALLELMESTGYNMVQENGQRKYGGPPPGVCKDHVQDSPPAPQYLYYFKLYFILLSTVFHRT